VLIRRSSRISADQAQTAAYAAVANSDQVSQPDRLDKLSEGSEVKILALKAITIALAALKVPFGGLALALYTKFILDRGIITDRYARLPERDVMDSTGAVLDTPADAVLPGQGVTVDQDQPYPVTGWIEARRAEPVIE
jgi:hypothetical protein